MTLFDQFGIDISDMKVLFVEDNEFALSLGKNALTELGFDTIITAHDGQQAYETITMFPVFDLIISDWNMPNMDGLEFFREVRKRWPSIPFVMVTVNDRVEQVGEARKAGVDAYVLKPYTLNDLRKKVVKALRLHLVRGGDPTKHIDAELLQALEGVEKVTEKFEGESVDNLPPEMRQFERKVDEFLFPGEAKPLELKEFKEVAADVVMREGLDGESQELAASLIDQLQDFFGRVGAPNPTQLEVIKLHIESIRAVNSGRLKGVADDVGPDLVNGLKMAMEKSLAA